MRKTLLLSSVLAGLALAAPVMVQAATSSYGQNPYSTRASNINATDTHSNIAPELPPTGLGPNATVADNLGVASTALKAGKTGLAQHALEDAETLALTRSVPYSGASAPDNSPLVTNINSALQALGSGNLTMAGHYTNLATQAAGTSSGKSL